MRNLLGVVVLALAMATLSACGSVTASRSSFEDIGGRYVLQTFQGHTLPTGHPDGWTITAGNMELKLDGTYTWNPPPVWAPRIGVWGVVKTEEGFLKLCFEDNRGRLRYGFLVLMKFGTGESYYMNWTRTRGDVIIWSDRIWRADRPKRR